MCNPVISIPRHEHRLPDNQSTMFREPAVMPRITSRLRLIPGLPVAFWPISAFGQDSVPALSDGDTAWIVTATGLALFYGGLVRARNLLSVLMHCFSICCVVSVLWLVIGYSLAFGEGNAVIGGLGRMFLAGVGTETLA